LANGYLERNILEDWLGSKLHRYTLGSNEQFGAGGRLL
jgi:hypothetical protein